MGRFNISTATIATMTAVAAIALGIIDSMQTRAHNRLSVTPYLVLDFSISGRPTETVYVIRLDNEGVGPAVINSMKITAPPELGGRTYAQWADVKKMLEKRGVRFDQMWNLEVGDALGVEAGRELLRAVIPTDSALFRIVRGIDVEVNYASIYREEFRVRLRD